jgi:uncharacterized protein YjeT (DUF2065 family)
MPPLQALVALHGMWLLLLAAPAAVASMALPQATLRRIGGLLLFAGTLGLAALAAREAATWLTAAPAEWRHYYPQRVLYTLAVTTEWPVVQAAIVGSLCVYLARRRRLRERRPPPGPGPYQPGQPPADPAGP